MTRSSNSISKQSLKEVLDRFYSEYDFKGRMPYDPIKRVVNNVLSAMGSSPYNFLLDLGLKQSHLFSGLNYRFNKNDDILCLLYSLAVVPKKYGRLEKLFNRTIVIVIKI